MSRNREVFLARAAVFPPRHQHSSASRRRRRVGSDSFKGLPVDRTRSLAEPCSPSILKRKNFVTADNGATWTESADRFVNSKRGRWRWRQRTRWREAPRPGECSGVSWRSFPWR